MDQKKLFALFDKFMADVEGFLERKAKYEKLKAECDGLESEIKTLGVEEEKKEVSPNTPGKIDGSIFLKGDEKLLEEKILYVKKELNPEAKPKAKPKAKQKAKKFTQEDWELIQGNSKLKEKFSEKDFKKYVNTDSNESQCISTTNVMRMIELQKHVTNAKEIIEEKKENNYQLIGKN